MTNTETLVHLAAALINLTAKFIKLLNNGHIHQRDLLSTVLTPIYNDLQEIHRDYLAELSTARNLCAIGIPNLKNIFEDLKSKSLLREPEIKKIVAQSECLLFETWQPEVKAFLTSTHDYFHLSVPLIELFNNYGLDGTKILEIINGRSGYSHVIEVLKYLIGEKLDSNDTQIISLIIFDDTLNSLRIAWPKVSSDFAKIEAKTIRNTTN
jgi:hypothetical protein